NFLLSLFSLLPFIFSTLFFQHGEHLRQLQMFFAFSSLDGRGEGNAKNICDSPRSRAIAWKIG
ncbi:MAG: hypothetical protein K6U11_14815, partial [bacterium]|nr:hypothetical protein [bacterium]